jgi:hypothetical protein
MSLQKTVRTRISDLYRRTDEFKRDYQPRNDLVKDENGDLLGDSHNILNWWNNNFSQLLNAYNIMLGR